MGNAKPDMLVSERVNSMTAAVAPGSQVPASLAPLGTVRGFITMFCSSYSQSDEKAGIKARFPACIAH